MKISLDHCVIHVSDWGRSNAFYHKVLGAEIVPHGNGFMYRLRERQLNCHGPGVDGHPNARLPVMPGNSDLCFVFDGSLAEAQAHLGACQVPVELGPVQRFGGRGAGTSLYFRDPDGSLLEFIIYLT